MGKPKNQKKDEEITLSKKDKKKVDKLQAQIPYHEGRGNKEEVQKIKDKIDKIWTETRAAYEASLQ